MTSFNGLGVNLSNLYRLSDAVTRSISPENFTGEKGKGGMATEGTGAIHARGLGKDGGVQGWKVSPSIRIEPGETRVLADIEGVGGDPADLADLGQPALARPDPAHLLGRSGAALGRVPDRRFLLQRLEPVCAGQFARRLRQSRPRVQLLLGDAVPQGRAHRRSRTATPTTTASSTTRSTTR